MPPPAKVMLKYGHILLAILVYLSSLGVALNKHYCRESLKDVALFLPAKSCRHEALSASSCGASCPFHQYHSDEDPREDGCCEDTTQYLKVDQPRGFEQFAPEESSPPALLPPPPYPTPLAYTARLIPLRLYKPPLIVYDRCLASQTFLC
jgi:hypothetical protein